MDPVLVFDRGNSSLKAGLVLNGEVFKRWWLDIDEEFQSVNEILDNFEYEGIAYSSVVPSWNEWIKTEMRRRKSENILEITSSIKFPFSIDVDKPELVGSDRLCTASGIYSMGYTEMIIVDAGTAITVDLVSSGEFRGGVIFPGVEMIIESFYNKTAIIPDIKKIDFNVEPPGNNTDNAIECGLVWGISGAIKNIIRRIRENHNIDVNVMITGGGWEILRNKIGIDFIHEPDLMIKGIEYLYRMNTK